MTQILNQIVHTNNSLNEKSQAMAPHHRDVLKVQTQKIQSFQLKKRLNLGSLITFSNKIRKAQEWSTQISSRNRRESHRRANLSDVSPIANQLFSQNLL